MPGPVISTPSGPPNSTQLKKDGATYFYELLWEVGRRDETDTQFKYSTLDPLPNYTPLSSGSDTNTDIRKKYCQPIDVYQPVKQTNITYYVMWVEAEKIPEGSGWFIFGSILAGVAIVALILAFPPAGAVVGLGATGTAAAGTTAAVAGVASATCFGVDAKIAPKDDDEKYRPTMKIIKVFTRVDYGPWINNGPEERRKAGQPKEC